VNQEQPLRSAGGVTAGRRPALRIGKLFLPARAILIRRVVLEEEHVVIVAAAAEDVDVHRGAGEQRCGRVEVFGISEECVRKIKERVWSRIASLRDVLIHVILSR
jgi:hypothetical protein